MTKFSGLSAEEEEILDIFQEECAEIIQTIAKIKRHGYSSYHPDGGESNFDALLREMGDLDCIQEIWKRSHGEAKYMMNAQINASAIAKLQTLPKYTHHIDWTKY